MENLTTSEFRNNLKRVLDRVNDDHEPVAVRRGRGRAVVVMDAADYASIVETLYLVRSPANAERLAKGMEQHRKGERKEIDVAAYLD
ncbi:type II toxin-antitoxin system Phd/YefM family antitoxin [Endothiovibrio diazotrophicus]